MVFGCVRVWDIPLKITVLLGKWSLNHQKNEDANGYPKLRQNQRSEYGKYACMCVYIYYIYIDIHIYNGYDEWFGFCFG
jgi:hypothetical protein